MSSLATLYVYATRTCTVHVKYTAMLFYYNPIIINYNLVIQLPFKHNYWLTTNISSVAMACHSKKKSIHDHLPLVVQTTTFCKHRSTKNYITTAR